MLYKTQQTLLFFIKIATYCPYFIYQYPAIASLFYKNNYTINGDEEQ